MDYKYITEQYISELDITGGLATISMGLSSANLAKELFSSVGNMIKQASIQSKWDRYGCEVIMDEEEQIECEIRSIDEFAGELTRMSTNCRYNKNPQECQNKIREKIMSLREKKTNKMNRLRELRS